MKFGFPAVAGVVVVIAIAGAIVLLNRPESASAVQKTDDAYVQADYTLVAPQVSGLITQVPVQDYQPVKAGQALLTIDQRPFELAVAKAKANVANAHASIEKLNAQISQQQNLVTQAQANVDLDEANLTLASADKTRFTNMAKDGSGTHQAAQQATAHWQAQQASLKHDQAALAAAQQQIAILRASLDQAHAAMQAASVQQKDAELNLSYTQIKAPVDGVVTQRRARVGGFAQAGQGVLAIVPLKKVYVEANFRETQLAHMQAGQPVTLTVDSYPGETFKGHVQNLAPASNTVFSAVPAHNATGNFTKITQRLPVRIALDLKDGQPTLRPGMSVEVAVDTE
ncbi:HlyD family secretion protein [Gallaecimonas mangrovi]|uniref:HlyD family secretion protein n=1 Tax=Gallaecimonas mangrovi TaxID=2291597 RepID=UPI000E20A4C0|nr:HlyD family secretion protein [Gallaecimonas mangrovi]